MNSWHSLFCPSPSRLRSSLTEIAITNRHTDCNFIIETEAGGNKVFPCHKLIFSCASEVFDRMLYGDYNESNTGEVKLSDVDVDIFEKFRIYAYGYEYEKLQQYDFDTLLKLAEFGNKYLVESIKEDCIRELLCRKDSYDAGELLKLFQCSHFLNNTAFIDQVSWDVKRQSKTALNNAGIYALSTDVFKSYINVIEGKLSEAERFNLIELYLHFHSLDDVNSPDVTGFPDTQGPQSTENSSNVSPSNSSLGLPDEKNVCSEYVKDLIGLINFSQFTPKEYYEGPGKSNFFTVTQKYEHLYKIAKSFSNYKDELEEALKNNFDPIGCFPDSRRANGLTPKNIRDASNQAGTSQFDLSLRRFRDWRDYEF